MKKVLRILPFVLVLVIVVALQVKWDTDNRNLPFPEPFGRESTAGVMTPNRAPLVIGDNQFVYLHGPDLVYLTVDPATAQATEDTRPVPNQDIYSATSYAIVKDDIFWVGKDQKLKRATWQGDKWSDEQLLAGGAKTMNAVQSGGQSFLFAGADEQLVVFAIMPDSLKELHRYPIKKPVYINGTTDAAGKIHVGVVDQISSVDYDLDYLTYDPATKQASDHTKVRGLSVGMGSVVYENSFGIDRTHAYFMLTRSSGKSGQRVLNLYTFPLAEPGPAQEVDMKKRSTDTLTMESSSLAFLAGGQADELPFVFTADVTKNPRVSGVEVLKSSLRDGKWEAPIVQVTNQQKVALNPVFSMQGDTMTVVYTVQTSYEQYQLHYTLDQKAYASVKNVLTMDDYLISLMTVPQYIGMSIVTLFIAMAWPLLSYAYLFYYVLRNEDSLHDHAGRHVLITVLLYVLSQLFIFLNYANLERFHIYAPDWMQSTGIITLIFLVIAVLSYLCTVMFCKIRFERNALAEFSYFMGLNLWTVLLGFSYYMAY